ncbi:hypothetical protein A3D70_02115 [Candidatus Adlerbacteria bacterium RIFCSPHIGHO2_02_FULL_54_18]|uniref:Uncharacterized protein n=1 Tax=Candidatus Adlerbacteria bacterium RIFCSPHIGHO2_02_FULL_54_18 TaxID=1797241 RepID=A0A1F4Y4W6_9BACT|nr:MAG: hypothetical protein A3D70_02115 [Candidatus Adlerbacteria bacterium RIFCSPHIGHO2_02_FULL_54_18]
MCMLSRTLLAAFLVIGLSLPVATLAAGIPFGGRVATIFYCLNGVIYENIIGPKGGLYIWVPGTLTFAHYQIRPGVNQIGTADVIFPCVVSYHPLYIVWAPRIQIIGTSLAI